MTVNVDGHASDELRLQSGRGPFGILSFLKRYGTLTALIASSFYEMARQSRNLSMIRSASRS